MRASMDDQIILKLSVPDKRIKKPKNYDHSDILYHTFDTLSNLHKLLPNHLLEMFHYYRNEEDKKKCENSELSGLERILARHEFPKEVCMTPKPSKMPLWKRKTMNSVNYGWKHCHLWSKSRDEPPVSTIVVRWLKKNMQPTEDLQSIIQKLSVFGPIQSVTRSGRQSAVVVFKDATSACNAINAFQGRIPGTMFQCSWQHMFMSKDKDFSKYTKKVQPKEHNEKTWKLC
ncbi:testis expressed protein 56 [Erinaceus europaeus]|uniref:Testis expressed protein 56 n=1 Tax=Erinaceus europaeus TaxID=9365 RepID=A0A1S2ZNY0_ERIEU|nr:testis expressed protein 56 [Erinaceus europaeus]XP_060045126.1 testis expressed protein 56 [Erinaceus europaeus]